MKPTKKETYRMKTKTKRNNETHIIKTNKIKPTDKRHT